MLSTVFADKNKQVWLYLSKCYAVLYCRLLLNHAHLILVAFILIYLLNFRLALLAFLAIFTLRQLNKYIFKC